MTAPSVSITAPVTGKTYERGDVVAADYSCADDEGGTGVAWCEGTVGDGEPIDTATVGPRNFTVTARDAAGNQTVESLSYRVVQEVPCPGGTSTTVRWFDTGVSGLEFVGSEASEHFRGTGGDDTFLAGNGNDAIVGQGGDDVVDAGTGDDHVTAGDGDDVIDGGPGSDTIVGGEGVDTLVADDGQDRVAGVEIR